MTMNILQQEDVVKSLPDQRLLQEAKAPSGQVPQFLVVSELQRRQDMRKRFANDSKQESQGTVADRIVGQGIAAMQQQQQRPQQPPVRRMAVGGSTSGGMSVNYGAGIQPVGPPQFVSIMIGGQMHQVPLERGKPASQSVAEYTAQVMGPPEINVPTMTTLDMETGEKDIGLPPDKLPVINDVESAAFNPLGAVGYSGSPALSHMTPEMPSAQTAPKTGVTALANGYTAEDARREHARVQGGIMSGAGGVNYQREGPGATYPEGYFGPKIAEIADDVTNAITSSPSEIRIQKLKDAGYTVQDIERLLNAGLTPEDLDALAASKKPQPSPVEEGIAAVTGEAGGADDQAGTSGGGAGGAAKTPGGAAVQGVDNAQTQSLDAGAKGDAVGGLFELLDRQKTDVPDMSSIIEQQNKDAYYNALIQLGAGIAGNDLSGGIQRAGAAAMKGREAARKLQIQNEMLPYKADQAETDRDIQILGKAGLIEAQKIRSWVDNKIENGRMDRAALGMVEMMIKEAVNKMNFIYPQDKLNAMMALANQALGPELAERMNLSSLLKSTTTTGASNQAGASPKDFFN